MPSLAPWPRPRLQPGGGRPHLFWKVHGRFDNGLKLLPTHRSDGVPDGLSLQLFRRQANPEVLQLATDASWQDALDRLGPATASALQEAPTCAVLQGSPTHADDLTYLRDAIGLVQALLDAGGVAVCDLHQTRWWAPTDWAEQVFAPAAPVPHRHVLIVHRETDQGRWYRTRGLRTFGRPDLSLQGVRPSEHAAMPHLLDQLIRLQADGAVLADGLEVRLPNGTAWSCETIGQEDDPDWHNRRIALRRVPESGQVPD